MSVHVEDRAATGDHPDMDSRAQIKNGNGGPAGAPPSIRLFGNQIRFAAQTIRATLEQLRAQSHR